MKIQVSENVLDHEMSGEVILLDLATGTYFGLDPVGTRMWHLIKEHGSTERVIEVLMDEYEVGQARLRSDLGTLTQELSDRGLVRTYADQTSHPG